LLDASLDGAMVDGSDFALTTLLVALLRAWLSVQHLFGPTC
jgi:hypothetical protein